MHGGGHRSAQTRASLQHEHLAHHAAHTRGPHHHAPGSQSGKSCGQAGSSPALNASPWVLWSLTLELAPGHRRPWQWQPRPHALFCPPAAPLLGTEASRACLLPARPMSTLSSSPQCEIPGQGSGRGVSVHPHGGGEAGSGRKVGREPARPQLRLGRHPPASSHPFPCSVAETSTLEPGRSPRSCRGWRGLWPKRVPPATWHLLAGPAHVHSPHPAHLVRCLSGLMVAGLLRASPSQLGSCSLSLVRGVTGGSGVPLPQAGVPRDVGD